MRRLLAVLLLVLIWPWSAPPAAHAQPVAVIDQAVAALRKGDPVFVHPDAEHPISAADSARLRSRIDKGARSVFVAVLPAAAIEEAGGSPNDVPRVLYRRLGFAGTYAVVAGGSFRVVSAEVPEATSIADDAFRDKRKAGVGAILLEFVDRVERGESKDSSSVPLLLGVFVAAAILGALAFLLLARRRRRSTAAPTTETKPKDVGQERLALLADDLQALESMVAAHPEARHEYDAALKRFWAASAAEGRVVERLVDEARYAQVRTWAVIQGDEPPPPPPVLAMPGPNGEPVVGLRDGIPAYEGDAGTWFGDTWFDDLQTSDGSASEDALSDG
jgi:hypothetical protein